MLLSISGSSKDIIYDEYVMYDKYDTVMHTHIHTHTHVTIYKGLLLLATCRG